MRHVYIASEQANALVAAWREGYYSQIDFPVEITARPVRSGESALMMMILERVDFYVDDLALIYQSFEAASKHLI